MTRRSNSGFLDSDRDVAALVHGPGADPAALRLDFTRDLTAQGVGLERWWRSLGTVDFRPPARQTLCERVK